MRSIFTRARWIAAGLLLGSIAVLYAQEAQQINRPLAVTQGNVTISRGGVVSGGAVNRDYRTNTTVTTGGAATYTAAEVLTGLITRTVGVGGNVTDVFPTAANLVAAMPGVAAGSSFWLVLDLGASPNGTVTPNGASTGVTYAEGCAKALSTGDTISVLINITSSTAYRVVCVPGIDV